MTNETRPGFNPLDSLTGDTVEEAAAEEVIDEEAALLKAFNEDWVSRRRYDNLKIDRPNAIRIMEEHGLTAGQQEAWLEKFDADNLERTAQVEKMRREQAQETKSDEKTTQQTEEARQLLEKLAQEQRQQELARRQQEAEEQRLAGKLPGQEHPVQLIEPAEHAKLLKEVERRLKEIEQAKKPKGLKSLIKRLGGLFGR
ncbi:hypothetical protein KKE28_03410 [Patescibacteria group bacterium]|nr:hypothetical protein [Patescibacteria group bacterium]